MVLSAVSKKGGKDKAAALIKKHKAKVPIKDFRLWDYDQINTYLDNFQEVRNAYAAWVLPGDVLAEMMERIKPRLPNFHDVMANFLQKELLSDRFANLEQAGEG